MFKIVLLISGRKYMGYLTNVGVQKCDPPSPLIIPNKSTTHHGNHLTFYLLSTFRQQNQVVLFINLYN